MLNPLRTKHRGFRRLKTLPYTVVLYVAAITLVLLYTKLTAQQETNAVTIGSSARHLLQTCDYDYLAYSYPRTDKYSASWFTDAQLNGGAVIVHILFIIYLFSGLAIVCDSYLEPSLSVIASKLNLSEDLSNASIMAVAGSSPELMTSIMSTFVAQSDIGFGTIIGSAVFNMMAVVAATAIIAPGLHIHWYQLTRDSVCYSIAILALMGTIVDQKVEWWESFILLAIYSLYLVLMYYNDSLRAFVDKGVAEADDDSKRLPLFQYVRAFVNNNLWDAFMYAVIAFNVVLVIWDLVSSGTNWIDVANNVCSGIFIAELVLKHYAFGFFNYWRNPVSSFDGVLVILIILEWIFSGSGLAGALRAVRLFRLLRGMRVLRVLKVYVDKKDNATVAPQPITLAEDNKGVFVKQIDESADQTAKAPILSEAAANDADTAVSVPGGLPDEVPTDNDKSAPLLSHAVKQPLGAVIVTPLNAASAANEAPSTQEDEDEDSPVNPFEVPDDALGRVWWSVMLPFSLLCFVSIPDNKRAGWAHFYPLTCVTSLLWIGGLCYLTVWQTTLVGAWAGITDPVMGLTFLALGCSVPDLMGSVATAREGKGDAAVSSSLCSNVFDVLIGLALPWFIYSAFAYPGTAYPVFSSSLTTITLTLFVVVALLIFCIHLSGWTLNFKLAIATTALFALFTLISVLMEYGVVITSNTC